LSNRVTRPKAKPVELVKLRTRPKAKPVELVLNTTRFNL